MRNSALCFNVMTNLLNMPKQLVLVDSIFHNQPSPRDSFFCIMETQCIILYVIRMAIEKVHVLYQHMISIMMPLIKSNNDDFSLR